MTSLDKPQSNSQDELELVVDQHHCTGCGGHLWIDPKNVIIRDTSETVVILQRLLLQERLQGELQGLIWQRDLLEVNSVGETAHLVQMRIDRIRKDLPAQLNKETE